MRRKRTLFARYSLTTKEQLLHSVKNLLDYYQTNCGADEEWSVIKAGAIATTVEAFYQLLQHTALPDLREWWYYDYKITGKAIELEMCHCSDVEYVADSLSSAADDAWFTLLRVPCTMLTVQQYADRYGINAATVKRWIKYGKMRFIEKRDGEWLISEFVDPPGRKYISATYRWNQPISQLQDAFPFAADSVEAYISRDHNNRNAYRVILWNHDGGCREEILDLKKRQLFERALIEIPGVEIHEMCANLFFENRMLQNKELMQTQVAGQKKRREADDGLDYGPVIVIKGKMKGRIGYYDCEDFKGCIVYFGNMRYYDTYHFIRANHLSNIIPTSRILERLEKLDRELFDSPGFEEDYERLLEMNYCDNLIFERYLSSMNNNPTKNFKIFISHSTKDLTFARALATDLMDAGYEVFLDDWSIAIGENIIHRINENLDTSDALVLLISRNFSQSVCCRDEWTAYYMRFSNTHPESIFPVILDDSNVPTLLAAIKYIRYHEFHEQQDFLRPLLSALAKAAKKMVKTINCKILIISCVFFVYAFHAIDHKAKTLWSIVIYGKR